MMDGTHQNTKRMTAVLDAIAAHPNQGMRLVDLVNATGLQKSTLHRILAGLLESDLIDQNADTHRFFIGPKVLGWASASRMKHGLVDQLKPVLARICDKLGDTVYLTIKHGNRATYVERYLGSYPLKALPREVGEQRPLGIGAGPLAILAGLDDEAMEMTIAEIRSDIQSYGVRESTLRNLIVRARKLGYALHEGEIQEGMVAIGLPLRKGPSIVGAISVAATLQRLPSEKRQFVAETIRREIGTSGIELACELVTKD